MARKRRKPAQKRRRARAREPQEGPRARLPGPQTRGGSPACPRAGLGSPGIVSLTAGGIAHGFVVSLWRSLNGGFDDDGGGEIGHEVGVGFVELEDGGEGLDGAAEGGRGDGAGEFEVGGDGEIGIGVEVDGGLAAGDEASRITVGR